MTDDLHHLAAAYALDAVEPDEARRFEAHLRSCDRCAAEVREFRTTAAELAGAASTAPPNGLRDRVLGEVATTRQRPPLLTSPAPTPWRRTSSPASTPRWRLGLVAAAAAVLAVVLGAGVIVRDVVAQRDEARELAAVLAAPDARFVPLDGPEGPTVRVVWSASAGAAVVVGADLPDPGPDRVYELWALADDGPRPAALFDPDADGRVEQRLDLPAEPTGGWGVTVEPDGGSPQPTGEILFVGAA